MDNGPTSVGEILDGSAATPVLSVHHVRASCGECHDPLTIRKGDWWHAQPKASNAHAHTNTLARSGCRDLCTEHYWKLSRGERKLFVKLTTPEQLGNQKTSYVADFSGQWWAGRGTRIALLCGGGMYERPVLGQWSGGAIQACDETSCDRIEETLEHAGFTVIKIDIEQLGTDSAIGASVRETLSSCRAVVIPGGHDIPQAAALGELGKAALACILERGGGLVGICAGAWLLGHGTSLEHNYRWLPVACDPKFGDNGLVGMASLTASSEGAALLGDGLTGEVMFDESPSMSIIDPAPALSLEPTTAQRTIERITVDATYASPGVKAASFAGCAALERMGEAAEMLVGTAAVVRGVVRSGRKTGGSELKAGDAGGTEFKVEDAGGSELKAGRIDGKGGREPTPGKAGRVVLIGPHFEMTRGGGEILARAVAWGAGAQPP